jgi:hypothetical protein
MGIRDFVTAALIHVRQYVAAIADAAPQAANYTLYFLLDF